MTQKSKLKKRIRERAKRTGESYSAARLHILADIEKTRATQTQKAAENARQATAKGAVSEERCIEKTGHGFDHWFGVLDRFGAPKMGHKASARYLQDEHHVSAWYAQSITVTYERARGLRELHQNCTGSYQCSVSRVLKANLKQATTTLLNANADPDWLHQLDEDSILALQEALASERLQHRETANHIRVRTDQQRFELRITSKKDGRSTIQVTVSHIADRDTLEHFRTAWKNCLDQFKNAANASF